MSTKQCEDMLVGKGVRPTVARILVLQNYQNEPARLPCSNWRRSWRRWINRPFPVHWPCYWNIMRSILSKMVVAL